MTIGFVETVSVHLSLIENSTPIASPLVAGARQMTAYGVPHLGYKVRRWGGPKTGNVKTAKWRKRRGGSFCSPLNQKFKGG